VKDSRFEGNGSDGRLSHGGGIAGEGTNGQIQQTIFEKNHSVGCLEGYQCYSPGGGAIYLHNSSFVVQDSTFISNTTRGGGGIYNWKGTVSIDFSSFSGNRGEIGSAILNRGSMEISNTTFTNNQNDGVGGAIYNRTSITITKSIFSGNSSSWGGALYNGYIMNVSNSTFIGNSSRSSGAINNEHHLNIDGSTFCGNTAQENGGGIANIPYIPGIPPELISISNSTFNYNYAGIRGGGIFNAGASMLITNNTLSGNAANDGGGIYLDIPYFITTLTLKNTIIADSISGGDCIGNGQIVDGGHNLDSDGSCNLDPAKGSLPNTDPNLGPLQNNGGPTWTQALQWGSPAIDTGDNATCPPTDQRGVLRPLDGNWDRVAVCDIGSFEAANPPLSGISYLPVIFNSSDFP
jgi:hypothetical protein